MQVLFGGLETNDKPVQASDGSRYTLVDDQTEQAAKSDISVVYRQTPEHLELWCRYDPALFKQETIANLLAWFGTLARAAADTPGRALEIGRAPVCTPVTNSHHQCSLSLSKKKSN